MTLPKFDISKLIFPFLIMVLFGAARPVSAQDNSSDSLFSAKLMEDNLALYHEADSLEQIIQILQNENIITKHQLDSLQLAYEDLQSRLISGKRNNDSLTRQQIELNRSLLANKQEILRLNTALEEKSGKLRENEYLLAKAQLEIKELSSSAEIDKVKLEGKIDVHSTKLEAKDKEISYLKKNIEEKDALLKQKTDELFAIYKEKDNSLKIIDSLARALNQKELEYIRVSERLKIIEAQYNEIMAKQTAATNKKKKIRFIQGVGIKNYRTPDWELAPQSSSSSSVLVISNKNAGKTDVDYITGVSLSLYDLTKPDSKFTYDAGLFVGFGGQNLFKNFYIGPSFKVFDFFHVNTGANFAEYQQLKPGFKEGDQPGASGLSSVLVKQWKTNFFIGFTLDLELLGNIPKKL